MAQGLPARSPAFQFYAKDFLSDGNQAGMSLQETGAYIRLICFCWNDGSIPDDPVRIARMIGATPREIRLVWPAIRPFFMSAGEGRLTHPRVEQEREKQAEFRRRQSDASNKRWESHRNAAASNRDASGISARMPQPSSSSSSSSSSSPSEEPIDRVLPQCSSEAARGPEPDDVSPTVLAFPVVGRDGPVWRLTANQVEEWRELFPTIDILDEARKALAWIHAHQERRKTSRGMPKFLVSWLTRSTDRARVGPAPIAFPPKTSGNLAALERFVARGQR